ncbi:guanosine diphosphatase [Saccharomycopsis crataegensis]|uniref:guanosine-diphosphatase n=1 Tax=Saccharomycopsis crataegensis TaxID=43959 RepID=A0AAV5QHP4_9ASCO|nr:guanosine diphosphatase [Saccharomycopsis crataegensis]
MIRIATNRNSRYVLISVGLFFFVALFYLTSNSSPAYHTQLADSQILNSFKDKATTIVEETKSSFGQYEDADTYKGGSNSNAKAESESDSYETEKTSSDALKDSSSSESKNNEPPKPPYPQSPQKDKAGTGTSKEKVKADKAFSSSEQQKDGKTKSYSDSGSGSAGQEDSVLTEASKSNTKSKSGSSSGKCDADPEYVVMIDAGSSGSRVHIYKFDVCYSPPKLLNEDFEMLKPGLSSFDTDIVGAAKSLDPLLELAVKSVPKEFQGCTPVAVKATAGLRLLGEAKSDAILQEVRRYLETEWPFAVVSGDGISIMDGADEGVYAWITANYLIGNIGSSEKIPTAAVFDLGGGSTQIVFEPEFSTNEKLLDGDHKYSIDFGNRDFELYQFSHLGYGLMEGRQKIYKLILESYLKSDKKPTGLVPIKGKDVTEATVDLISPCVSPGNVAKNIKVKYSADETYLVNFIGAEEPSGAQCRYLAEKTLNKDLECAQFPCSFNGIHQPSLIKNFKESSDMYVFSFFYDRTNPLGMPSSFTLGEMRDLAKIVCNGDSFWEQMLGAIDGSLDELASEPNYCLDLSFMVAMLHTGYDIPLHRELKTAKKIAGNELGWCLGASLPLLDKKGWKCRVQKEDETFY